MSREILYRGLRADGGGWVEGSLLKREDSFGDIYLIEYEAGEFIYAQTQVIPSTVGQLTGLHDKDGRRIFEGDKWMAPYGSVYAVIFVKELALFTIGNADGNWASYPFTRANEGEVIGNIHEEVSNG